MLLNKIVRQNYTANIFNTILPKRMKLHIKFLNSKETILFAIWAFASNIIRDIGPFSLTADNISYVCRGLVFFMRCTGNFVWEWANLIWNEIDYSIHIIYNLPQTCHLAIYVAWRRKSLLQKKHFRVWWWSLLFSPFIISAVLYFKASTFVNISIRIPCACFIVNFTAKNFYCFWKIRETT